MNERSKRILVCLLLYIFALLPRLHSIHIGDPQGDEVLWEARSAVFTQVLREGSYSIATSHLGHPAIPAVVTMSLGTFTNSLLPTPLKVDRLTAARSGNAYFSSLIAPLMFMVLISWFNPLFATLAALITAVDPQHIAVSRMAHVDSNFSVFVLLTFGCYLLGAIKNVSFYKMAAGFFWGLCLASKPTAFALVPAFLLFNCIRRIRHNAVLNTVKPPITTWGDIWAILIGLLTLSAVFTRFWHHQGPFLTDLRIMSPFADAIYVIGFQFGQNPIYLAVLSFIAVSAAMKRNPSHISRVTLTCTMVMLLYVLCPQVFENFIRYFLRLPSLAEFVHLDIGSGKPFFPGGYVGLLFFQMPTWIVACSVIGILCALYNFWKQHEEHTENAQQEVLLFSLIILITWLVVLSVSPRNYVRYTVPVLPLLNILSAYGLVRGASFLTRGKYVFASSYAVALLCGAVICLNTHPYYLNFFNSMFGGVKSAYEREYPLFYEGHRAVFNQLAKHLNHSTGKIDVAVIGEYPVIVRSLEGTLPTQKSVVQLKLIPFAQNADFAIATDPLIPIVEEKFGRSLAGTSLLYRYERDGVPFASLYTSKMLTPNDTFQVPLNGLTRDTGGEVTEDALLTVQDSSAVYAMAERHKEGYLFRNAFLRMSTGNFTFGITASRLPGDQPVGHVPVFTVSVGSWCTYTVYGDQLTETPVQHQFPCTIAKDGEIELTGIWKGQGSVVVGAFNQLVPHSSELPPKK